VAACEDAGNAAEACLVNARRPIERRTAPDIELASELVEHRARVDHAEQALEMVGDDLATVEPWNARLSEYHRGRELMIEVIDQAIDNASGYVSSEPDSIVAAGRLIERLQALVAELEPEAVTV
jgi:hypothetical protein